MPLLRLKLPSVCSEEHFEVKQPMTFPDEGYTYNSHISVNTSLPEYPLLSNLAMVIRTIHIA